MEPQELLFLGFPPSVVVELLKTYAVLMNSDGNESYYKAGFGVELYHIQLGKSS